MQWRARSIGLAGRETANNVLVDLPSSHFRKPPGMPPTSHIAARAHVVTKVVEEEEGCQAGIIGTFSENHWLDSPGTSGAKAPR